MAEVEDSDDHRSGATEEDVAVTAAEVLMSFKDPGVPSAAPPPPLDWGSKGKRSRTITMAGILEAKSEEEEEAAVAKANGKMRASPPSPLDYRGGSGASTSGGENGPSSPEELPAAKRPRIGEPLALRGGWERAATVGFDSSGTEIHQNFGEEKGDPGAPGYGEGTAGTERKAPKSELGVAEVEAYSFYGAHRNQAT